MNITTVIAIAGCCALGVAVNTGCGGSGEKEKTEGASVASDSAVQAAAPAPSTNATEEGARAVLAPFLLPGADHAALSATLRPAPQDYTTLFTDDFAQKAQEMYDPVWESGELVIAPKEGQTELILHGATTEELKGWTGSASEFPEGYKEVAQKMKDGLTIYRFTFVTPGDELGMAFDGLVYVNGHWVIVPKPWRVES